MSPRPTARLDRGDGVRDLVLVRTFRAPIEDVWSSVTESEQLGEWIGTFTGEPSVGDEVTVTMTAEDGAPTAEATVVACDPPRQLRVRMGDDAGVWDLELHLRHDGGDTELTLVHHLGDDARLADVGPGWEYYLDRLVAARGGEPMPEFDAYHPVMSDWFGELES